MAQDDSGDPAQDRARCDHDEGEFQIVKNDLSIREPKRFEDRYLLALQGKQTRQHCIGHKCRHAKKDQREADRQDMQYSNFIRDTDVGRVIATAISASTAVRGQQKIQLGDDWPLRGARTQRQRQIVKCAIKIERGRKFFIGHPKDAISAVVGQSGAGA